MCNGTIASWLKETLTLANIRALGGSTRKAAVTYVASHRVYIRTIMETCDWVHTSMMYWYCIRCLPKEVLIRIWEKTSASIQGLNVAKIARDNPYHERALCNQACDINQVIYRQLTAHLLYQIEKLQSIPKCVILTFCVGNVTAWCHNEYIASVTYVIAFMTQGQIWFHSKLISSSLEENNKYEEIPAFRTIY